MIRDIGSFMSGGNPNQTSFEVPQPIQAVSLASDGRLFVTHTKGFGIFALVTGEAPNVPLLTYSYLPTCEGQEFKGANTFRGHA